MYSYKIILEEIGNVRELKNFLDSFGDTYASVNQKRKEVSIETSEDIVELCEALKEEGYEIVDLEMV